MRFGRVPLRALRWIMPPWMPGYQRIEGCRQASQELAGGLAYEENKENLECGLLCGAGRVWHDKGRVGNKCLIKGRRFGERRTRGAPAGAAIKGAGLMWAGSIKPMENGSI